MGSLCLAWYIGTGLIGFIWQQTTWIYYIILYIVILYTIYHIFLGACYIEFSPKVERYRGCWNKLITTALGKNERKYSLELRKVTKYIFEENINILYLGNQKFYSGLIGLYINWSLDDPMPKYMYIFLCWKYFSIYQYLYLRPLNHLTTNYIWMFIGLYF